MDSSTVSIPHLPLEAGTNDTLPGNATCLVPWSPPESLLTLEFICPIIVLILFNTVVIIGNTLVVVAVFTHTKLRTVTNTFIVSLAVADLLLGISVLPFSSANEVLRYWPFGTTWCDVWLAIDVWVCTASILNLCAISLDRYLAISRPFKYPRLMSHVRARVLVTSVWVVAFLVCFPPLIGWKKSFNGLSTNTSSDTSSDMSTTQPERPISIGTGYINQTSASPNVRELRGRDNYEESIRISDDSGCQDGSAPTCILYTDSGYIIYSALGSFWIPMWIMVFFYWRIYRAASKTTTAIRKGVLVTKGSHFPSSSPDNQVTLRVHRGGGHAKKSPHSPEHDTPHYSAFEGSSTGSNSCEERHKSPHMGRYKRSPKAHQGLSNCKRVGRISHRTQNPRGIRITFSKPENAMGPCDRVSNERQPLRSCGANSSTEGHSSVFRNMHAVHNGSKVENVEESQMGSEDSIHDSRSSQGFLNKVSRIQLKTHIKRINKEKKAAKTVGIIVGCFIVCWAPFFTVYLLGAFCLNCTPDILFTVFFWLGYCNSAVNPFLYAMCSKDFRYAFKKLLRCRVERRRVERTGTRFLNFINSIRIQISSKGSDSNSE